VARVVDFGIAKAAGRMHETRDGRVKGKVRYMAPEQFTGSKITPATDVYASGIVLWEALTLRRLFESESDVATMYQVMKGKHDPPSLFAEIPAELDEIVSKALSLDPAARFRSAEEMAQAIEACVAAVRASQVAGWVKMHASVLLQSRGALVAELERELGPADSERASAGSEPDAADRAGEPTSLADTKAEISSARSVVALQTSAPGMEPSASVRRGRLRIAGAALLVLGVVGIAVVRLWRADHAPATALAPSISAFPSNAPEPPPTAALTRESAPPIVSTTPSARSASVTSTQASRDASVTRPTPAPVPRKKVCPTHPFCPE
jgi:serine/threonine-protein kinase